MNETEYLSRITALENEVASLKAASPIDNPFIMMAIMQTISMGVAFAIASIKDPASKARYGPMLLHLADSIYIAEGITPPAHG